jgi:hypothetical protein
MSDRVPECFPSAEYQWVSSAHTRIKDNTFHVYFNTKTEYENALNNPFGLVHWAKRKGCDDVAIYVRSSIEDRFDPMIVLQVDRVLALEELTRHPACDMRDRQAV